MPGNFAIERVDVVVQNGSIAAEVSNAKTPDNEEVIDANG
jgi:dihydroorotase-like cyclic amidohydrolase